MQQIRSEVCHTRVVNNDAESASLTQFYHRESTSMVTPTPTYMMLIWASPVIYVNEAPIVLTQEAVPMLMPVTPIQVQPTPIVEHSTPTVEQSPPTVEQPPPTVVQPTPAVEQPIVRQPAPFRRQRILSNELLFTSLERSDPGLRQQQTQVASRSPTYNMLMWSAPLIYVNGAPFALMQAAVPIFMPAIPIQVQPTPTVEQSTPTVEQPPPTVVQPTPTVEQPAPFGRQESLIMRPRILSNDRLLSSLGRPYPALRQQQTQASVARSPWIGSISPASGWMQSTGCNPWNPTHSYNDHQRH